MLAPKLVGGTSDRLVGVSQLPRATLRAAMRRDRLAVALIAAAAVCRPHLSRLGRRLRRPTHQLPRDRRLVSRAAGREPGAQLSRGASTLDPYAAPGGQFVPIAPLFDTITATAVVLVHGRDADADRRSSASPRSCRRCSGRSTVVARVGARATSCSAAAPACSRRRCSRCCRATSSIARCSASSITTRSKRCWRWRRCWRSCIGLRHRGRDRGPQRRGPAAAPWSLGLVPARRGGAARSWSRSLASWLLLLWSCRAAPRRLAAAARVGGRCRSSRWSSSCSFQDPRMHRYGSQIVGLAGLAGHRARLRDADARVRPSAQEFSADVL